MKYRSWFIVYYNIVANNKFLGSASVLGSGGMALSVKADETALDLFRRASRKPLRTGLVFLDEVNYSSVYLKSAARYLVSWSPVACLQRSSTCSGIIPPGAYILHSSTNNAVIYECTDR